MQFFSLDGSDLKSFLHFTHGNMLVFSVKVSMCISKPKRASMC